MRIKAIVPIIALALALAVPGTAQEAKGTLAMSLEECIVKALKDNLGVAIQVLGPQISAEGINVAQDKFIPTLSLSARSSNTENASYSYIDSTSESTVDKTQNFTFINASQALPTGGTFTLDFTGYKTTTTRIGNTINPRYGTTLRFNLNQPLLKNFGPKIARREILIAKNNLGVSEENLRNTLMTTVYNVESAYWNLVYSIENLDVRRQSLQLAKDLLEKNQRSVEVGTLAPMEVLSARAEVATREADLIQAETQIQSSEDQLKLLLNITEAEDQAYAALVPKDKPTYVAESRRAGGGPGRGHRQQARPRDLPDRARDRQAQPLATPRTRSCRTSTSRPPSTRRGSTGRGSSTSAALSTGSSITPIPGDIGGALTQTAKFKYPELEPGPDHEPAPVQLLLPGRRWPSPGST